MRRLFGIKRKADMLWLNLNSDFITYLITLKKLFSWHQTTDPVWDEPLNLCKMKKQFSLILQNWAARGKGWLYFEIVYDKYYLQTIWTLKLGLPASQEMH